MSASIDDQFGARFLAVRKASGASQEAIVERIERDGVKLHVTAIGKIERGERRVTVGEAVALARCFDLTIDQMLGLEGALDVSRTVLDAARLSLTREIGAFYRAYAQHLAAAIAQIDELSPDETARAHAELYLYTPARVVALTNPDSLRGDLLALDADPAERLAGAVIAEDAHDREAIVEAAGGWEKLAALESRRVLGHG